MLKSPCSAHRIFLSVLGIALLAVGTVSAGAEDDMRTPPPFRFSGFAAQGREQAQAATPPGGAASFPAPPGSSASLRTGTNVNVIGSSDVVQQATIGGVDVFTCNPGKQTAQNETSVAVDPANAAVLVAGANDYRLYEPSENRYDGSGGFYRSTDGGGTWTAGFLPGLVKANGGPYESAGDPAVSAGPSNTFYYANIAFNRTDDANSVAVSRSTDGGATWATSFVVQTSAADGATLFNDKEWVAADPSNASVAYVTWTQFRFSPGGAYRGSPIVISKTTDGGATWSAPKAISRFRSSQGSVVQVDSSGRVHVTFETFSGGRDVVAYSVSGDGGATFSTRALATINDIPSPLPGANYRTNSFPALAVAGSSLHVVWSNWNGSDGDVAYLRSTDGGATWSGPVAIGGGAGDQFFPWVAAGGSKVYASWFNRTTADNRYGIAGAASNDGGGSWTAPAALSTASSDVAQGNLFGHPNCQPSFVGDYSGLAFGSDGVAHSLWTDVRTGNDTATTADQDPYAASMMVG